MNDLSSLFVLAHTCLRQAKTICSNKKPPTVPPKPSCLSLPPPLPIRPAFLDTAMIRTRSDFQKSSSSNVCTIDDSSDDEEEEEYTVNNKIINKKGKIDLRNVCILIPLSNKQRFM